MAPESDPNQCPICLGQTRFAISRSGARYRVQCSNCGTYDLTRSADAELADMQKWHGRRPALAYSIRRLKSGSTVDSSLLRALNKTSKLPPARERIDNLLLHLATEFQPGARVVLHPADLQASLGCETEAAVRWVFSQAVQLGFVERHEEASMPAEHVGLVLSAHGWDRVDELLRSGARSQHAFMAMKFGDAQSDTFYRRHLRPAVLQTGFDLRRTDEAHKAAGLIDNRMRVEIRTARFLLCDLSHGNQGAYWEAGFAEGIGRPVIYICSREAFGSTDPSRRPHFDTAHQPIIVWSADDPAPAMAELKDMIRATLPDEAKMQDGRE